MEFQHIGYTGPAFDADAAVVPRLPPNLRGLLEQINGFVQFGGGLHVRGVCAEPEWHSVGHRMQGDAALHRLYPAILETDIPFAQDCLADQFLLREGVVHRLRAETGEVESLQVDLWQFFEAIAADPVDYLGMHPLLQFIQEGGSLEPGQVLQAYPPFCTQEAAQGVSLNAVPAQEAILYLAEFSAQIAALGEGQQFSIKVEP